MFSILWSLWFVFTVHRRAPVCPPKVKYVWTKMAMKNKTNLYNIYQSFPPKSSENYDRKKRKIDRNPPWRNTTACTRKKKKSLVPTSYLASNLHSNSSIYRRWNTRNYLIHQCWDRPLATAGSVDTNGTLRCQGSGVFAQPLESPG